MKRLLLIILLIPSLHAFAQQNNGSASRTLTVVDSNTAKGIEKATISFQNRNILITDLSGRVMIGSSILTGTDRIKISSVGYKTFSFSAAASAHWPDTIRLSPLITVLREIKIQGTDPVQISLAALKKQYGGRYLPGPNEELAKYIPNIGRVHGIIHSLEFAVNDGLKGIEMPFRVQVFSKLDQEMYPSRELISDSLIVYNKSRQTRLSVDISKYQLELPENGFFIVFEVLSPEWYSKKLFRYDKEDCVRVPGVDKDYVGKSLIDTEEKDRHGQSYSLLRRNKAHWEPWTVLSIGEDFAMGATITPK